MKSMSFFHNNCYYLCETPRANILLTQSTTVAPSENAELDLPADDADFGLVHVFAQTVFDFVVHFGLDQDGSDVTHFR